MQVKPEEEDGDIHPVKLAENTQKVAVSSTESQQVKIGLSQEKIDEINSLGISEALTLQGFILRCKLFQHDVVEGDNISMDDVNETVATLVVVNALLLTIPYSLAQNFTSSFLDQLEDETNFRGCGSDYNDAYNTFRGTFLTVIFSSIIELVMTVIYSLLKPKVRSVKPQAEVRRAKNSLSERRQTAYGSSAALSVDDEESKRELVKFLRWWQRARILLLLLCFLTATAVISILALSYQVVALSLLPTKELCTRLNNSHLIVGCTLCAFFSLFTVLLIM